MTMFNFDFFPGFADQLLRNLKARKRACAFGGASSDRAPVTQWKDCAATLINNGFPEAGGGGSSNDATGVSPTPGASDDDGGEADPEPARRRSHTARKVSEIQQPTTTLPGDALLKIQIVLQRTSLSKSTLYAKIKEGSFPEPVRLGARCSRWKASELDKWLSRIGR